LDDEHVVIVFNTTPVCPAHATKASIPGNIRVVVLNTAGDLQHVTDLPYVADLWQRETPHHGLAIGPRNLIMVIVNGVPWSDLPNADGMVRVFTEELQPVQDILTETASTAMEYGTFTHFGVHFEGVTPDRRAVVFAEDTGIGKPQKCILFEGAPLKQVSECNGEDLHKQRENYDVEAPYPISSRYIATAFLGRSADQSRSTVFFVRDRSVCDLAGVLCPGEGTLVVYETRSKKTVFRRKFSLDAGLALSPDGKRIASFVHDRLEIIAIG
jgi:hypothetical protein